MRDTFSPDFCGRGSPSWTASEPAELAQMPLCLVPRRERVTKIGCPTRPRIPFRAAAQTRKMLKKISVVRVFTDGRHSPPLGPEASPPLRVLPLERTPAGYRSTGSSKWCPLDSAAGGEQRRGARSRRPSEVESVISYCPSCSRSRETPATPGPPPRSQPALRCATATSHRCWLCSHPPRVGGAH